MSQNTDWEPIRSRILVRLDTLIKLRWLAISGQTLAVLVVRFGLGFPLPWMVCLGLIAFSAMLNFSLTQRFKLNHRLPARGVFALLCFDIIQLGVLLFLTGGLQNPFAILLMAPVIVSATSLKLEHTVVLGGVVAAITTFLLFFHFPLPWYEGETFALPLIFTAGVWVAIVCTLAFTAIYAFRVAEEARKLADALAATELVMQREQHLSVLDGLATAAAHELGTPLATIALVAKEMVNTFPEDSPLSEDARLLRSQAQRCREILQKLTSLSSHDDGIVTRLTLRALVEEALEPLRDFGVELEVTTQSPLNQSEPSGPMPQTLRNPAVQYGLGNIIDNAVDFAKNRVTVELFWDSDRVGIVIVDDGPGFHSDTIGRIGDPFLTTRKSPAVQMTSLPSENTHHQGLGLGLFIAKTLLERNGAELDFSNVSPSGRTAANGTKMATGACVKIVWPRKIFESNIDLADAPHDQNQGL